MKTSPVAPAFSVILPSFNGADTLPACLDALGKVARPDGGVEFIFVDNRSADATGALLRDAANGLGGVFLREERPGKSHALNTGVAAARGAFLVFTDDDTLARPDWLLGYEAVIALHPDVGVFAGQIRPHWAAAAPAWLAELADRGQVVGCTPKDHPAGPFPAYWVKGANMMVRRSLLEAHRFDTERANFGASQTAAGGEDSKLIHALEQAGEPIVYVPEASLRHIVQANEATAGFILSRQVRIGRGNALVEGAGAAAAIRKTAEIAAYALIAPLLLLLGKRASAFQQLMKIARRLGMLHSWIAGRRQR